MSVEDWEARRILDELRQQRTGPDYTTFTDRLDRTLRDYTGRRTIQAHMVQAVAELAYGYVAEQLAAPTAERDAQVERLAGVIERLEDRVNIYRTRNEKLERALSEKRTIREEREASRQDGETDVTISNGYVGWTVAGLEEIAYRLRCGGAVDDTPVEVDKARAKASVPAPNLVTLDASPRKAEPTPSIAATEPRETGRPGWSVWGMRLWYAAAFLAAVVTGLVLR